MIEQEQSQLTRLDWVLRFMATHAVQGRKMDDAWRDIKALHPTIHIEGNESYRHQVFSKLIKDGYLEDKDGKLWITLEGVLFSHDGGYQSHYERLANQRKIQSLKDWLLAFGSVGAAVAAAALLAFQIYNTIRQ